MNIAPPKKKKRYRFYSMTCNELEQPPQAKVKCLNMHTSSGVEADVCKLNSIDRSCRKSDRKREGQLLFLIVTVSYNARYAKLREAKKARFPDFWHFSPDWLIIRLGSTVLHILRFLPCFIVLFVSHFQMLPVLCAASSVRL